MINIGDTVRFLNATGGGIVTRIKDNLAYVADSDGFETPVLIKECVVVAAPAPAKPARTAAAAQAPASKAVPTPATPAPQPQPEETPEGEQLSLILGFEAADLRHLSSTTFDATLVNLSNYYLHYTIATRDRQSDSWSLRAAGTIEPSTADFVFELTTADLPDIDRIAIQAIAYKTDKPFTLKAPLIYENRLDATRFARLHAFRQSPYFEQPALMVEIDETSAPAPVQEAPANIPTRREPQGQRRADRGPRQSKSAAKSPEIIECDLHATELLDTTAGLSPADILNYQVDTFRRVMDENLRHPGQKIVFIHGNGDGVLRRALLKELNYRYKGHDVADASFREYGFGATMVTIRNTRR